MAIYGYITKDQLIQQIANRLYDSPHALSSNLAFQFWTGDEIALYLNEALQTWNALTAYHRGDFTFTPPFALTFYDLTSAAQLPNTLRPLTLHDTDLYSIIQYHLLEPVSWNPWVGASLQFSADDLMSAVARRRDEVLSLTGCMISHRTVPAVAGRIQLPDTVIDVRRMAYLPSGLFSVGALHVDASPMWPEDAWAEQSFNRNYTITPAGTPFTYLLSTQPPISFDTDKPPALAGSYDLLTVEAGPPISVSTPSLVNVPDDWAHVVKWGALADLLSRESNAKDAIRAQYCEMRYRLGIAGLQSAPALLAMRFEQVSLPIDSMRNADLYNSQWQQLWQSGTGHDSPPYSTCLTSGLNVIALAPPPNHTPGSLMATVVRNAPLPVAGTDFVQVGRDELDAIIDYAQHLAAFKQGGDEFVRTMPLFQRFLKAAAGYNGKLNEIAEFTSALLGVSQMERGANPTLTPDAEQEVSS